MSLNLQHIPCPAGNKCNAFKCVFGHEKEQKRLESPAPAPAPAIDSVEARSLPSSIQEEPPRKRVKVDAKPSIDEKFTGDSDNGVLSSKSNKHQQSPARLPQTATKPISPPPSRRPTSKPSLTSSPSPSPAQPSTSVTATTKPPSATKPEILNPRLVKSSPTSHEIRYRLLKLIHAEYARLNAEFKKDASDDELKLVFTNQELIKKALDEEHKTALEKGPVYSSVMKHKIMHYKRMGLADWKAEREKEAPSGNKKAREALDGPKKIHTGLTTAEEVEVLRRLITPIDGLSKHGYVSTVPLPESIKKAKEGQEANKGWEKCDRCQQRFQVFPGRREGDGALTSGGTCTFHWGKAYVPTKAAGEKTWRAKRYQCCGEDVGQSTGCFLRDHHVYKTTNAGTLASILNYAETPDNPSAPSDRAVSFDCEMGYTVYGLELIRLTVVSWPLGETLLDVLVRPIGEVLDLNSRFSGVWPEDLARAMPWPATEDSGSIKGNPETGSEDGEVLKKALPIVPSPEAARDLFFSLISPTTPVLGHGLENDLNAVRIVHPTLVDTVLLYPHKGGLPFRNGLKTLMNSQLNVKIQQETGPKLAGHDSAEDARAAGDLVRLKVMEKWKKLKLEGWKVEEGQLISP